jgi:tRNA A-37 threonylcarbamoyl transferase component Bud32
MDDLTCPPTLPESPPVPAHEVARMASTALRSEVVLRRTWWGRTVFLKRVRGTAAWISALRHFFFVVLGKLMAPRLDLTEPDPTLGGSVEAGRLQQLHEAGLRVPRVLGVHDGWIVLEDCGETLQSHLGRESDTKARQQALRMALDDLLSLHAAGYWHGGAQLRNLTLRDNGLYRIDFEQAFGGRLPARLLQMYDLVLFLSSALRFADQQGLDELATRYRVSLKDADQVFMWRRTHAILRGFCAFFPLRLAAYEYRRIRAVERAFAAATASQSLVAAARSSSQSRR